MNIDLEKLLELAGKATPATWSTDGHTSVNGDHGLLADTCFAHDAAFISAANPATVTELVNMVKGSPQSTATSPSSTRIATTAADRRAAAHRSCNDQTKGGLDRNPGHLHSGRHRGGRPVCEGVIMHKIDRYLMDDIHIAWIFAPQISIFAFVAVVMLAPDMGYEAGVRYQLPDPVVDSTSVKK